jgi:hypothetical protein
MVRLIAIVLVLFAVGFGYEEYTGNSIGVKRLIGGFVGVFGGEYGVATGAATPAFGGLKGIAGSAGAMFGN